MDCLKIPTSLDAANAIIVACSGIVDWRPMFVLGLQSAFLFVATVLLVGWMISRLRG